ARDVQNALHPLRVREGRRIEQDQLVAGAAAAARLQPFPAVRLDELVLAARDIIERQIAPGPVEVGARKIYGSARRRPARCRVRRRRAGVSKQVEKAFATCMRAQTLARQAMIEKQSGVQVLIEIDLELQATFLDHVEGALLVDLPILIAAAHPAAGAHADPLAG